MEKKQSHHETTGTGGATTPGGKTERSAVAAAAEIGQELKQGIEKTASRSATEIRQGAGEVASEVKQVAVDTGRSLREKVGLDLRERVDSGYSVGRDRLVSEVSGVATALKSAGQQLREQERSGIADYAEQFGERIDRAARYLQDRDAADLVHEVEDFARRRPGIFLAGAAGLGLLAARFFKSSSR